MKKAVFILIAMVITVAIVSFIDKEYGILSSIIGHSKNTTTSSVTIPADTFTLAGKNWTIEEFQRRINKLFEYQAASGNYKEGVSFHAEYALTDNNAHFFHIYSQVDGRLKMTEESIVVTDGQVGLATTDSASTALEEIIIALAFGESEPNTMASLMLRGQAKNNNWKLTVDNKEFRYYQDALQLLIIEK